MVKRSLRIVSMLLCLLLPCALIAGCAARQDPSAGGSGGNAPQPTPQAAPGEQYVFLREALPLADGPFYDIGAFVSADGRLWSVAVGMNVDRTSARQLVSLTQKEDGSVETAAVPLQLPDFALEEPEKYTTTHIALTPAADGSLYSLDCCIEKGAAQDAAGDRYTYFLSALETAGGTCGEAQRLDLPQDAVIPFQNTMQPCLVGGTLYVPGTDAVYTASARGKGGRLRLPGLPQEEAALPLPGNEQVSFVRALQPLPGEKLLLYAAMNNSQAGYLCTLDAADNSISDWRAVSGLEGGAGTLVAGADGACWLWNTAGLYHLDAATGTATPASRWQDSGIAADELYELQPLADGAFLAVFLSQTQDTAPTVRFAVLRPTTADVLDERTVLTVGLTENATVNTFFHKFIEDFNVSDPDIRLEIKEYDSAEIVNGVYISNADEAVTSDLINHTLPDILLLSNNMNIKKYIRKGLFLDLYPFLDADSELSRDDIVPCVLAACAYGDTLPVIVPQFSVETLSGPTALVGEEFGWTIGQLLEMQQSQNCDTAFLGDRFSRSNLLMYLVTYGGNAMIDYETGVCNLNSEEFIRLLELSAAYPSGDELSTDSLKDQIARKDGFLIWEELTSFYNLRGTEYLYGEPTTYIGYPSLDGSCWVGFHANVQLGISHTCQNPEAAWRFVRALLLEQGQRALQGPDCDYLPGFPARMDLLQEMADAARQTQPIGTQKDVSGYVIAAMGLGPDIDFDAYLAFIRDGVTAEDDELWSRPLTNDEIEQYMRILLEADNFTDGDVTITGIIQEEAEAYYNGQRTADETAKIIQNRVQTYLDEQG